MLTPELVEKGTLTDKERSVVLQCCEEDKCFIQEGPLSRAYAVYSVYLLYWYKSTHTDA
jgi:hypothetical protein